jgi:hypothetical protein
MYNIYLSITNPNFLMFSILIMGTKVPDTFFMSTITVIEVCLEVPY